MSKSEEVWIWAGRITLKGYVQIGGGGFLGRKDNPLGLCANRRRSGSGPEVDNPKGLSSGFLAFLDLEVVVAWAITLKGYVVWSGRR